MGEPWRQSTIVNELQADCPFFVNVPEEVLVERLATRKAHLPQGAAFIPEVKLKEWLRLFQPRTHDELERRE